MKSSFATLFSALAVANCSRQHTRRNATGEATSAAVDIGISTGEAQFLGSGFIYGWPDNSTEAETSIPDHFVTEMKWHANRAGGAQLPEPSLGWAQGGYGEYIGRFNSTLSNYRTTRKYGGDFILLPHDLWGSSTSENGLYPGDNGDWSEMEAFYEQLIGDLKANDMLEGLVVDLWNEPEGEGFWPRSWDQYLEYYVHAHSIVRSGLASTLISGPSGAHSPSNDSTYYNTWLQTIADNDAIPDIYSWHQIGTWERKPDTTIPDFNSLLEKYGLPQRPIDINEYGWTTEQNPACTVFYLSQLERHNLRGLRSNWENGEDLHNWMGNLVWLDGDQYAANGDWYVYQYYAGMTGDRLQTAAATDLQFDVFATNTDGQVKILAGTRTIQSAYDISVYNFTSFGLPEEGSISVRTYRFDWNGQDADTGGPVNLGTSDVPYSGNVLTLSVNPPTNSTAYAFELSVGSGA